MPEQTAPVHRPRVNRAPNVTFGFGSVTFIYRVAAVTIAGGRVLVGRQPGMAFWYLPGGRVLAGESAEAAVDRELVEELGTPLAAKRLVWVAENFFAQDGRDFHEIGLYFSVELPPHADPLGWTGPTVRWDATEGIDEEWRWVPLAEIDRIDLLPAFLTRRLTAIPDTVEHILHRG